MSDVEEECIARLDFEFSQLLQEIVLRLREMNFREKMVATEWIAKLKNAKNSISEITLRNAFASYFVLNPCIFKTDPFNEPPPSGPLSNLADLLPCSEKTHCLGPESKKSAKYLISELIDSMPDNGQFICRQPVPSNGFFAIMHLKRTKN